MVEYTCYLTLGRWGQEKSRAQGHLWLHRQFGASLGYTTILHATFISKISSRNRQGLASLFRLVNQCLQHPFPEVTSKEPQQESRVT